MTKCRNTCFIKFLWFSNVFPNVCHLRKFKILYFPIFPQIWGPGASRTTEILICSPHARSYGEFGRSYGEFKGAAAWTPLYGGPGGANANRRFEAWSTVSDAIFREEPGFELKNGPILVKTSHFESNN